MTYVVMTVFLLASLVLQMFIPSWTVMGEAKVPVLFAVVIYYALRRETRVMLLSALISGFLHDAMSPVPLGYSVFCFCLIGWLISFFREYVMTDSVVTQVFFGAVASLGVTFGLYILLTANGYISYSAGFVFLKMIGTALLGMLTAPIVFRGLAHLDCMVGNVVVPEEIPGVIN